MDAALFELPKASLNTPEFMDTTVAVLYSSCTTVQL